MAMPTRNDLEKRVKRGAHFLDAESAGWYGSIDLHTLEMMSGTHCVLGQVGGDYTEFADSLGLFSEATASDKKAVYRGFNLAWGEQKNKAYSMLTELWAIEVAKRLVRKGKK